MDASLWFQERYDWSPNGPDGRDEWILIWKTLSITERYLELVAIHKIYDVRWNRV